MNYFQVVGMLFGTLTLLIAFFWVFFLSRAPRLAERLIPEKKPFWLKVTSWVAIFFVVLSWLLVFQDINVYSVLITTIISFTMFKFIGIFLNYDWFRLTYFEIMAEDKRAFYAVVFTTSVVSLMLIYLCLQKV